MHRIIPQRTRLLFLALCLIVPLAAAGANPPSGAAMLNFNPPRIVVAEKPTRLMLIDGPPVRVSVESTRLEFVVNTDWTIFHDLDSRAWYVLDDGHWLRNNMLSSGNWVSTTDLPDDFLTLQLNSDWPEIAEAMPPRLPATPALPVLISYEPTELVLIDGEMAWEPIADTGLKFVSNTSSDLFLLDARYYLLLAGRWFTTKDVNRKWYAVKDLPPTFASIPPDHPRARVLASVPGTEQARLAAQEVTRSHSRSVAADAGDGLTVPWFGEPRFVAIEGTALRRGENTPYQVLLHNNFYYLCHEGAWFRSSSPVGPWTPAREVPEAIYTIPATDPAYNVTFVRVDAFDDSTGRAAYSSTGGYYGKYYSGSSVIYGTGWYHPGYYSRSAYWRYPSPYGYWGPYGAPYYGYSHSETYNVKTDDTDWEWALDGSKRRVYRYGPRNVVGGEYVMPESDGYKGDGRQRPESND
jgi:hypothetical protein